MKITASRTLMKSVPELWELLDDEMQLRDWSSQMCNGDAVEVVAREPQRLLGWRCKGAETVLVRVMLAEKGFGTQVLITARAGQLSEGSLEQVLDDLAEPQRRPFSTV
jgi:hypothetical protein